MRMLVTAVLGATLGIMMASQAITVKSGLLFAAVYLLGLQIGVRAGRNSARHCMSHPDHQIPSIPEIPKGPKVR